MASYSQNRDQSSADRIAIVSSLGCYLRFTKVLLWHDPHTMGKHSYRITTGYHFMCLFFNETSACGCSCDDAVRALVTCSMGTTYYLVIEFLPGDYYDCYHHHYYQKCCCFDIALGSQIFYVM